MVYMVAQLKILVDLTSFIIGNLSKMTFWTFLESKIFARLRRAMFFLVNLYKSRAAGARKILAQTPTFKEPPLFRSKKQQGGFL